VSEFNLPAITNPRLIGANIRLPPPLSTFTQFPNNVFYGKKSGLGTLFSLALCRGKIPIIEILSEN
jgi:hypothetical protein